MPNESGMRCYFHQSTRLYFAWALALFSLLYAGLSGRALATGGDLHDLLPTAAQTKEWIPKGNPKILKGDQIFDYMDGAGEIPMACDYQALAVQEYAGKAGGTLTIELYDMGSSANAFGLYSMKRLPNRPAALMGKANVPIQAQAGFHELLFHRGRYTALVFGDDSGKVRDSDLLAVGNALVSGIKEVDNPPDLLKYLPAQGYEAQTAKYFHGKTALDTVKFLREDIFNMKSRPDVAVASYTAPSGKLMVIRYGSASAATQALHAAQASRDTQGMVLIQEGRMLGVAWSLKGKTLAPALVEHLKGTLHKPGPPIEGKPSKRENQVSGKIK